MTSLHPLLVQYRNNNKYAFSGALKASDVWASRIGSNSAKSSASSVPKVPAKACAPNVDETATPQGTT
eukprot:3364603-Amphidinium_carterae.1